MTFSANFLAACVSSNGSKTLPDFAAPPCKIYMQVQTRVCSWRFEGRTSRIRVTIRKNCLKSLNMGYTLHISWSSPIQNPLSWYISDLVQSKSAWTGLDYESSGLIQSIPSSGSHLLQTFDSTTEVGHPLPRQFLHVLQSPAPIRQHQVDIVQRRYSRNEAVICGNIWQAQM